MKEIPSESVLSDSVSFVMSTDDVDSMAEEADLGSS